MGAATEITVTDGIAQIVMTPGPSGRLMRSTLVSLQSDLDRCAPDDSIEIIILRGKGDIFPSGITTPQGGGDDTDNLLSEMCRRIELSPKPVVAVLTGAIVGAGAELALAAHYRLVHQNTRVGFPNARLGLVPSAGATQRLPRLVGSASALEVLIFGALLPVASGTLKGISDRFFEGDTDTAIAEFAKALAAKGARARSTADVRIGFADAVAYQQAVNRFRKRVEASPEIAPKKILAAVEAAILLPIEAGLAFEEAAAEDCSDTEQSKAMSHLFHAEQVVAMQVRRSDLPEVSTIGVLGGSATALQIVLAGLEAGLQVKWLIRDPNQQRDSVAHVRTVLDAAVSSGRLSRDRAERRQSALHTGADPQILEGAHLVLRATRGQRGVPIPAGVPVAHCLPGADPRLALHFASAASASRLVEIMLGPEATEDDRRIGLALARRIGKLAVVETAPTLSLHDRFQQTLWRAADALVDLGQSPYAVDDALRTWGMAHPPFETADALGLKDVVAFERADGARNWSAFMFQLGRDGRSSGRGFYTYDAQGVAQSDPDALYKINSERAPQTSMPPPQIVRLILGAMANTGAKVLREGVVPRAAELDVLSVFTQLVPNWRGGMMHAIGAEGLLRTTRDMQALDHPDRDLWTPEPVFAELIKYGRSFDDL